MKRWLRAAIPFAALTVLVTGTLIVHAVETPDTGDPEYLAPDQVREISGGGLAERLRARGIRVDRVTTTDQAVDAVGDGPATLFLPAPDLADLTRVRGLPAGTRVVAVNPSDSALRRTDWPLTSAGNRWTTGVQQPDCDDTVARQAGAAAVLLTSYQPSEPATVCYAGALVTMQIDKSYTVTVVGSPDPFRDDRIAEHGNAALAVGLLAQQPRVVWLDVHERDRPVPSPTPTVQPPPPPPVSGEQGGDGEGEPGQTGPGSYPPGSYPPGKDSASPPNPLFSALPPALLATLALLALILLA
ncbi:MAG TPA: DUF4350 domain-containing protein, partial [Actinoplanes sp.]|nr:DUF4350 domain-containing protein [Actinoplanes sp.]